MSDGGPRGGRGQLRRIVKIGRRPRGGAVSRTATEKPSATLGLDDVRAPLTDSSSAAAAPAAPAGKRRLRRRDLLAWGGAATLLPAVSSLLGTPATAATPPAVSGRSLSVGFIAGSDGWPSLHQVSLATLNRGYRPAPGATATPLTVVPADQLIAGDQRLALESVRLAIHGLYPVPAPPAVRTARLIVLFDSPEAGLAAPAPFFAWSYEAAPAPSPSAPLKLTAPLGTDGSLRLALAVEPASAAGLRGIAGLSAARPGGTFTADFTVDWFAHRPKLQRGVYLLALGDGTWSRARQLPIFRPGGRRPLDLLSLIVSFEPLAPAAGES